MGVSEEGGLGRREVTGYEEYKFSPDAAVHPTAAHFARDTELNPNMRQAVSGP